jgi:hypothetical protein
MTYDALARADEIMDASGVIGWQTIDFWVGLRNGIAAAITAAHIAGQEMAQKEAAAIAQHICDTFGEAAIGRAAADAIRSIPSKET